MEKKTAQTLFITGAVAVSGIALVTAYKKNKEKNFWVYQDKDMRNSRTVDKKESVKAKYDSAEVGLTQLDSAYRSEWQANAFPQTHREMERLEKASRN